MLLGFNLLILCVMAVTGFVMYDDPCNVHNPWGTGIPASSDFTFDVDIPSFCANGTFTWNYPKGHALITFHNVDEKPTTLCVLQGLGIGMFTITDMTNNKQLGQSGDQYTWSCSDATTEPEIILKVDAPEIMTYMGNVEYTIS
ncbi:hypothetical protein ACF0H5_012387 [Mactra antiquata]